MNKCIRPNEGDASSRITIDGSGCKVLNGDEWNKLVRHINNIYQDLGVVCTIKFFEID